MKMLLGTVHRRGRRAKFPEVLSRCLLEGVYLPSFFLDVMMIFGVYVMFRFVLFTFGGKTREGDRLRIVRREDEIPRCTVCQSTRTCGTCGTGDV